MENNKKEEITTLAVPPVDTIVLAGDPEKQMEFAVKSSRVLVQILAQKPKKVMINGEQYLEFEDWQTLGRFYGATVGVEWTKAINKTLESGKEVVWGYEAKAIVYIKGEIVSSAEAMCLRDERNWAGKDEFTLRSMAQTRASAKALRNVLAWVAVLGGFRPTPLEEMPADMPRTYVDNRAVNKPVDKIPMARNKAQEILKEDERLDKSGINFRENHNEIVEARKVINEENQDVDPYKDQPWNRPNALQGECAVQGCMEKITPKVKDYSMTKFGKVLCYNHQKAN